jgi:hypothetical protein
MGFSCLFGVRRKTTKPKAPLEAGLFCNQAVFSKSQKNFLRFLSHE